MKKLYFELNKIPALNNLRREKLIILKLFMIVCLLGLVQL